MENHKIHTSGVLSKRPPEFGSHNKEAFPSNAIHEISIKGRKMIRSKLDNKSYDDSFKFMSYNVLADSLVARDMYSQASKHHDIHYRISRLFKDDIDPLDPDIICLQEKQHGDSITTSKLVDRLYAVCVYDVVRISM
jgi:hypothetical protein